MYTVPAVCLHVVNFSTVGKHRKRNRELFWGRASRFGSVRWSSWWWMSLFSEYIINVRWSMFCYFSHWIARHRRVHSSSTLACGKFHVQLVTNFTCSWSRRFMSFQALNITTHVLKKSGTFVAKVELNEMFCFPLSKLNYRKIAW